MNTRIRKYKASDFEKVLVLRLQLARSLAEINPQRLREPESEFKQWFQKDIGARQGKVFVAETGNEIIGFVYGHVKKFEPGVNLEFKLEKEGEITDVFVVKQYRNQGIGKKLITAIEEYFRSVNCDYVILGVLSKNRASSLYKRLGYMPREIVTIKPLK